MNISRNPKKIKLSIIIIIVSILLSIIVSILIVNQLNNKPIINTEENSQTQNQEKDVMLNKEGSILENNIQTEDIREDPDFIKEIRTKYPDIPSLGVGICSNNYGEYWILDKEGKKVYFSSLETFENALKICTASEENNKDTTNKVDSKENTNTDKNTQNRYIDVPNLTGLTEEEAIKKVKSLKIPYKIEYKEDISSTDKKEGTVLAQVTDKEKARDEKGSLIANYSVDTIKQRRNTCYSCK